MNGNDKLSDDPAITEVCITYFIGSDSLNHAKLTTELSIEPTEAWSRGDTYLGKAWNPTKQEVYQVHRKRGWGVWRIDTRHIKQPEQPALLQSMDIDDHARHLLKLLYPKKNFLEPYLNDDNYTIRFGIWWQSSLEHGSYTLSSELARQMCELSQYIKITNLCNMEDLAASRKSQQNTDIRG